MDSSTLPLLSWHLDVNLSSQPSARNFSKPFCTPPSPPKSTHSAELESRLFLLSPSFTSSNNTTTNKYLKRKPSTRDLNALPSYLCSSGVQLADSSPPHSVSATEERGTPSPPPLPSTPTYSSSIPSPSLTSTISTLQSSVLGTPVPVGCGQQRGYQWNASREEAPVRYKRKFPNIKQAKRLPRQRASSEWCVYAAVDTGGSYKPQVRLDEKTSLPATCSNSESAFKAEVPTTGIRTADTRASFHHDSPSVTKVTRTSGHRTADSTFSISKFKFPAPPSRDWIGTFGHLDPTTRPTTSPTIHYRGASFEVVNPHASLLLDTHSLEEPAELDGLLDDYLDDSDDSILMAYDKVTGEHFSSEMSLPSSSEGSRRRMLYTNPEDARRNIMRLPGAPSSPPEDTPTRSQQAGESGRPFLAFQPSTADLGHQAAQQSWVQPSQTERPASAERASSTSGTSTRSNPFDLHVSDHGNNPEDIEAANLGGLYFFDDNEHEIQDEQEGDIAMIEDDASTEATAFAQERSTTISRIYGAYEYNTPGHGLSASADTGLVEGARTGRDNPSPQESSSTQSSGINPFGTEYVRMRSGSARLTGPPTIPAPPPPPQFPTYDYGSDLPTSDQTYGATGELLQMTPAIQHGGGSAAYPWPTTGSPIGLGVYMPTDSRDASNSEHVDFVRNVGQDIPAQWINADQPPSVRNSAQTRRLSGRQFLRSSSRYSIPDDDEWESIRESESRPDITTRQSEDSIADVSDYASTHHQSRQAAQGQPTLQQSLGSDGAMRETFANKAHRQLMSRPDDRVQDMTTKRMQDILTTRIIEDNLTGKLCPTTPKVDKEKRKRDMDELNRLKAAHPAKFQVATERTAEQFGDGNLVRRSILGFGKRRVEHRNSFEEVMAEVQALGDGRTSSSRPLLPRRSSPVGHSGLDYSPTQDTFVTVHQAPSIPSLPHTPWTPLPNRPQPVLDPHRRGRATPSTQRTGNAEGFELQTLTRQGRARASIRGQRALLPLQMDKSPSASAPVGRPLTDRELMQREPNWTLRPPTNRPRSNLHIDVAGNADVERALLRPGRINNAEMAREQEKISRKYYNWAIWCPISALLFGLGAFDRVARSRSSPRGAVTEMCENHKFWALYFATPVGVVAYTFVGLITALLVVLSRR
ncbi:hypothetical protein KC332_g14080 [Hortaea werneckii]|uniref:Uncharacterized protein n=1 Tax=Hortaea werneckii EXF-2000 TaxID=1157616 RepID=A0A1Z5TBR2_HORWE|nr:hypothetical protein KC358_g13530 [Hortaea werneckii]OTA33454.1 hypothetical protein BTJ68_05648 [Hortaea werneckii EXF-2000]KAI6815524.1 hypothetical protein KC350_g11008 [Hortaea werneckii]KAI6915880.1 hypothetical protein KC348_g11809 [Hortaea werneckii]KAI6928751.1 hypothetical protein KC341_g11299 [Hortaea werneckii]